MTNIKNWLIHKPYCMVIEEEEEEEEEGPARRKRIILKGEKGRRKHFIHLIHTVRDIATFFEQPLQYGGCIRDFQNHCCNLISKKRLQQRF